MRYIDTQENLSSKTETQNVCVFSLGNSFHLFLARIEETEPFRKKYLKRKIQIQRRRIKIRERTMKQSEEEKEKTTSEKTNGVHRMSVNFHFFFV